ncbi:MAG TPA: hypothetical protein PK607_15355 [Aggregatilineales bacterium]|nr:hypothetical protein [Aggregatilineales bacterium]
MQIATTPSTWRNDAPLAARTLSTEQAAAILKVKPQTLRAALCRDGHYMGLRPSKLPNRFLLWDASAVNSLLSGGAQ